MPDSLSLRTVAVDVDARPSTPRTGPAWPWWLVATLGPVLMLAAGWLLVAGACAVGWLTTPDTDLGAALGLATQITLLAHGAQVEIGGQQVSLVPLTLTLIQVVLVLPVATLAARQAAHASGEPDDSGDLWVDGEPLVLRVGGTVAASYTVALALLAATLGGSAWRAVLGGLVVGLIAGVWGSCRAVNHDLRRDWPAWLRAVPIAVGWAVLVCLAAGAAALTVGLVRGWDRVMVVADGLQPGVSGAVLLVLIHLAWLPNLVAWATAWVLGGTLTLGDGSVINQSITDAGFLPAIPVLGAVPEPGPGSPLQHWWLVAGVAAGVLAAVVVTLARPRARWDETALVGGLSGVLAGLAAALICSLASGGLGSQRLAHLGARGTDILVAAPSLLGLAGLLGGLVVGLLRRPAPGAGDAQTHEATEPRG